MRYQPILAALLAVFVAAPLVAQAKKSTQAACRVSATDAWVKRQAESFDDSKGGWSDDTLRTALLKAAGLTAPLTAPAQLGVQVEGRDAALGAERGRHDAESQEDGGYARLSVADEERRGRRGRARRRICSCSATPVSRARRCIG